MKRRSALKAAGLVAASAMLAACTGSPAPSAVESSTRAPGEIVEVNVWSWVTDLQKEADAYNASHPGVRVTVTNAGQGAAEYEKLRNAIKAGSGVPDAVFMDSNTLRGFVVQDQVVDLGALGADDHKKDHLPWAWDQMSVDGKLYAAPAGLGPAVLYYRKDLYAQYGLEVPKTWDDFKAQGEKLKAAAPDLYMANFPTHNIAFEGLISQTGYEPWGADGDDLKIELESSDTSKVASYWQSLLDGKIVFNAVEYASNEWTQAIAQNKLVSVIGGAWLPLYLQPMTPQAAGQWGVAQLPQWSTSESAAFDAGLAGFAVPKASKNSQEAADFIWWLTSSKEGVQMLVDQQSQFPSYLPIMESEEYASKPEPFFGGQEVRREFVKAAQSLKPYPYTPVQDYISNEFGQQLRAAAAGKTTMEQAVKNVQDKSIEFAKQQGYNIQP